MDIQPIIQAVRQGMTLCREVQNSHVTRNEKAGKEPVTIADYGTQAIINQAIMRHFPDDSVIAEESGAQFKSLVAPEQQTQIAQLVSMILGESVTPETLAEWLDFGTVSADDVTPERAWLVDPVDGTKGFIALRHYVIAVGFLQGSKPTSAILGAPAYPNTERGAIFHAHEGKAYMRRLGTEDKPTQIQVSPRGGHAVARALESVEKGHVGLERLARVRAFAGIPDSLVEQADSQEKYTRIAAGDAEVYLRLSRLKSTRPHMVWDHAPGATLVEAAGGKVTGLDGEPLDYAHGKRLNNAGIIASNGLLHERLIDAVHKLLGEEGQEQ